MAIVVFLNKNVKWPIYKINTYPKILTKAYPNERGKQ